MNGNVLGEIAVQRPTKQSHTFTFALGKHKIGEGRLVLRCHAADLNPVSYPKLHF